MTFALPRETVRGAADTGRLLRLRWDAIRSRKSKTAIIGAFFFICVAVVSAANMGLAVKFMAMQGLDTAAGIFARSWILSLERNEIGDIGAVTLGGAIIAAVFAPFTGSATVSIIPTEDLSTVRPARLHRYFDALLINAFSGIGLLQLFALTGIASVLTLEGNHTVALLVTWLVWGSVIVLTTTIGWALEWGTRAYGKYARLVAAALILAVVAVLVVRDPFEIRRLFGLGALYAQWMKDASLAGEFLIPAAGIAVVTFALLTVGLLATRAALNLPAPPQANGRDRRAASTSTSIHIATITMLVNSLYRTSEVRRPIVAILLLGLPAVVLMELTSNIQNALMMAVPLAVALAWGVNLFGLFGQAMPWLITQPRIPAVMPRYAFYIQTVLIALLILLLVAVATARGNTTLETALAVLCGGVTAAALSSAVSIALSVRKPIRARLSGRGDALVPPITALGYLALLLVTACAPAALVATAVPPWAKLPATALAVAIAFVIQLNSEKEWNNPQRRSLITTTVASN